jgi:hypothetical protein
VTRELDVEEAEIEADAAVFKAGADVDEEVDAAGLEVDEDDVLIELGLEMDEEVVVVVVVVTTEELTASVMLGYAEYIKRAALMVKLGNRSFIISFR